MEFGIIIGVIVVFAAIVVVATRKNKDQSTSTNQQPVQHVEHAIASKNALTEKVKTVAKKKPGRKPTVNKKTVNFKQK